MVTAIGEQIQLMRTLIARHEVELCALARLRDDGEAMRVADELRVLRDLLHYLNATHGMAMRPRVTLAEAGEIVRQLVADVPFDVNQVA